jgi:two-component system sensor histidine kinase AlgZ
MDSNQHMDVSRVSRGVFPPDFCNWRLALGIMAVTQVSVLLIGLGRYQGISWQWLSVVSTYGQFLALSCSAAVCVSRAWLERLSIRDAWLGCWVVALLTTVGISYGLGVIGTVLGFGPGKANLPVFMLKSNLAVGLVFMALLRYLFIRGQWQAELVEQSETRVQALQARIRPHFLFNSLNTIASLIVDDPESAERATEDLAELFRGSMRRADTLIPLAEELALGRKFLDMEQRRLGDRLQVDWDVSELPGDAPVLPLLLQPLLENAVIHGIQTREHGGAIKVFGRGASGSIVITISNPIPVNPDDALVDRAGSGMALRNVRNRLDLAFGDRASLITSQNEQHFFAVLTLPNDTNTDY